MIGKWLDSYFDEDDERVCTDITHDACQEVPNNFVLLLVAQLMTKFADVISSTKTVLPWIVSSIGAPAFLAGLLVPIREAGSLIPQVLIGGVISLHPIRKWFFVAGSLIQGATAAAMAWVALNENGTEAGLIIIALLIIFSIARGFCSIASKDVTGKTVPKSRRGRLGGLAASLASMLAFIVGLSAMMGWLFSGSAQPLLLIFAGVLWLLSAISFAKIVEFKGTNQGSADGLLLAKQSISILRRDKVLRDFVVARSLMLSSAFASPYIIMLVQHREKLEQSDDPLINIGLGLFIMVSAIAGLISSYFWGKFSDLSSKKVMLAASLLTAFTTAATCALDLVYNGLQIWFGIALFFAMTVAHQGVRLGRKTFIIDIAGGNKRTEYVAVTNTLIGIVLLALGFCSAVVAQISIALLQSCLTVMSLCAFMAILRLPEA